MKNFSYQPFLISSLLVISLLVSNCENEDTINVASASFTVSTSELIADSTIEFSNTSENASFYLWDFGDGGTSSDVDATHIYDSGSTYKVSLIAYGSSSADTASFYIDVASLENATNDSDAVTASFEVSSIDVSDGAGVGFTNTSLNATYYIWNFGDGGASSDENPIHIFDSSGTYIVSLIAIGISSADTATLSLDITLLENNSDDSDNDSITDIDTAEAAIFPGEGITGVTLYETTWKELKALYGTDTTMEIANFSTGSDSYYYFIISYEDLGLYFYVYSDGVAKLYDDAYVYAIIIWGSEYEGGPTKEGINIGSTSSDMEEAYGEADDSESGTYSGSITYTYYEYNSLGVAFIDLSSGYNIYEIDIYYGTSSSSAGTVSTKNEMLSKSFLKERQLKIESY